MLLSLLAPGAAFAQSEPDMLNALPALETASVAKVLDGGTLTLDDGKIVRLAGIEVPLPPLGEPDDWPWSEAARRALAALAEGRKVTVRGASDKLDRYGRITAELVRDDGLWLEGELVATGAVRVAPSPETASLAPALLEREAAARRQRRGLWQARLYAVRRPALLEHESGSFQLVETVVRSAEDRHGIIWLDLGGAAARIDRPARQRFRAAGLDPLTLAGKPVRLRGWIEWQGRAVLALAQPEAVELLNDPH